MKSNSKLKIILPFLFVTMTLELLGGAMTVNDPYAEECPLLNKFCHAKAACIPDEFKSNEYSCECAGGFEGDGVVTCLPPPVYLSISPAMNNCNNGSSLNTCFLTSHIGGTVRMSVQPHGAISALDWRIAWYKFYEGLPPFFHSFRERLQGSDSPDNRVQIDVTNSILTVSSIRDDEVYPNRFIAEITRTELDGSGYSEGGDLTTMDLDKAEWWNPKITRVYFMIETEPIEIGPIFPATPLSLNVLEYLPNDIDSSRFHYRWASEGEVDTLGRRDRVVVGEQGPTMNLYELDEDQLNGEVRGMAFGRNGRVPGRVLVAARRFKLKEDHSKTCAGTLSERICTCRPGYTLDGPNCVDIDECSSLMAKCLSSATCVNTDGSFRCECPHGYHGDGMSSCEDIDECKEANPCYAHSTCSNTPGSFVCTCAEGYIEEGGECTAVSEWSSWSVWSACAASCGQSTRSRSRECTHPESGMICFGPPTEDEECPGNPPCPVDGGWSEWSQWTPCTASCDGRRQRVRVCDRPTPEFGGQFCEGDMYTIDVCNELTCPVPGEWGPWGDWLECSQACGGTQTRYRDCVPENRSRPDNQYRTETRFQSDSTDVVCGEGEDEESRPCSLVENSAACDRIETGPTWSDWTHWSHCSQSCGQGARYRRRTCSLPPSYYRSHSSGSSTCAGKHRETQPCIERWCSRIARR